MNNADLVEKLAINHGLAKTEVKKLLDSVFAAIGDAAARGEDIAINGFGKFRVKNSPERDGRHPRTGEKMTIKASRRLTFNSAKAVKDKLAG